MPKKEPGYAKSMEELEAIVEEIESESIDVDVLTEKVKRASFLIGLLRNKLKGTESEVRKVLEGLDEETTDDEPEDESDDAPEDEDDEEGGGLF